VFYAFDHPLFLWQRFFFLYYMSTKKKILIIDDEVDACLLLKQFFVKKNCEVYCSHTLTDGLRAVDHIHPDILFLDNNLPDGLGWDCWKYILEKHPDVHLHLVTAYNNGCINQQNLDTGVRVWQKPISFKKLDEQLFAERSS